MILQTLLRFEYLVFEVSVEVNHLKETEKVKNIKKILLT